jgi:hypothetical protein
MLKEKVEGICSKLLKDVQERLTALKDIAFGYPDFVI